MSQPNVLFLMSDEHNHRYQSRLDTEEIGEPVTTPHLDAIAENGVAFEQTYCPMPMCTPSRQCMLTGKEKQNVEAWDLQSVLYPEHETMPGTFAENGYETCLVGKMHFQGNRQFNGFNHRPYGDLTGHGLQQPSHQPDPISLERLDTRPRRQGIDFGTRIPGAGVTEIPESLLQEQVVARETIAFLREHRHRDPDQPWFLCASFSRPHFPLTAPRRHFERYWPDRVEAAVPGREGDTADHPYTQAKAEAERVDTYDDEELLRARAAYFACVDFLDEVVGELLGTLDDEGFLENTIVVYLSDHGDMAGEHGLWWKNTWHEGSARVPWMMELPDHRNGDLDPTRIETPVNLIDVFPTLCGLTGIDVPEEVDGIDLSESIQDSDEPDRGPVFSDNFQPPFSREDLAYRMVRDGPYKYVRFREAPELLFDIEEDPHEQHNLAPDAEGEDAEALERLRGTVDETVDFEVIAERRERDKERRAEFELPIPIGTGNAYLMPDGRLVDAQTPLYKPDVLAQHPAGVFSDWPDHDEDRQ